MNESKSKNVLSSSRIKKFIINKAGRLTHSLCVKDDGSTISRDISYNKDGSRLVKTIKTSINKTGQKIKENSVIKLQGSYVETVKRLYKIKKDIMQKTKLEELKYEIFN